MKRGENIHVGDEVWVHRPFGPPYKSVVRGVDETSDDVVLADGSHQSLTKLSRVEE